MEWNYHLVTTHTYTHKHTHTHTRTHIHTHTRTHTHTHTHAQGLAACHSRLGAVMRETGAHESEDLHLKMLHAAGIERELDGPTYGHVVCGEGGVVSNRPATLCPSV